VTGSRFGDPNDYQIWQKMTTCHELISISTFCIFGFGAWWQSQEFDILHEIFLPSDTK
jgi:hypothetical protein